MTTYNDWQIRMNRINDNLLQLDSLVESYQKSKRGTDELRKSVEDLEEQIGGFENTIKDAEATASTFDREFLERKESFPQPFSPDKLYTLQDFTLFFFFISYCILVVAVLLTFEKTKEILIGSLIFGALSIGLIMRYA